VEDFFEFGGGESALAGFYESADEVADHSVEKSIAIEGALQNTAVFLDDADGTNYADGGFALVAWVGGEGGEVVFTCENFGSFAHGGEVQGAGDVPSATDFEWVERVGIDDAVEVGFSFGGEAGVEAWFLASDGKDADSWRKVEVEGFGESGRRVGGGDFAGGNLAEGVDAAIGAA
jgi:hypothetical protein